jgi:integrase
LHENTHAPIGIGQIACIPLSLSLILAASDFGPHEGAHPACLSPGRAALHEALGITTPGELRQTDHKVVITWERHMREAEHAAASTIRWRLAALSSLYKHLVRHGHAARNPVIDIERATLNRDEGSTLAFSKRQVRKLLDAPQEDTIAGLRDRAILSVGLQVGLRRAEIASLKVGDLHENRGYDSLRMAPKGGRQDALAINPQTAARICAYLDVVGHGVDIEGPTVPTPQAQRQAPGAAPANGPRRSRPRGSEICRCARP